MSDYEDGCDCPRCSGWGEVDCHCGGDLCVCENYGHAICPLCGGEGEVSKALYDRYIERQGEHARLFAEARAKVDAENEREEQ